MTNKQIARALKETAQLIKLTGGNQFRARAFNSAARTVEQLEESVDERAQAGDLTDLSGIGEGLADDIQNVIQTGSFPLRDELVSRVPSGVLDVLRVKGLGTKKVRLLWEELDITSLDELEEAASTGKLTQLRGFGKKTQQNVLKQVGLLREYMGKYLFAEAYAEAQPLLEHLEQLEAVDKAELTGGMRRKMEVVERIEVAAAVTKKDVVQEQLEQWLNRSSVTTTDERPVVTGYLATGLPVTVVLSPVEAFGTTLWELTGSRAHCKAFVKAYGQPEAHAEETLVYQQAGLAWVPPELREDQGEFAAAQQQKLPKFITVEDFQGSIHNHTTYSDGANTVEEMARKARSMGLSYLVICDHSRSLTIANGLSIERVREQQEEIDYVNQKLASDDKAPFRVLSGTESDILGDGSLDYPDEVLDTFDVVVASVHSRFNMTEKEATDRVIRAVENPFTTVLGHPTGRLLLRREGYPLDHERVIEACAANNVAIELNAHPRRLDVDWRWVRRAAEQGVLIAINPDAHSVEELPNTRWGVEVARKGWLTAEQCVNTKSLDQFITWLNQ